MKIGKNRKIDIFASLVPSIIYDKIDISEEDIPMLHNITAVFIGGGLGAVLRYLLTVLCTRWWSLPLAGTLTANMAGCLAIGCISALILGHHWEPTAAVRGFVTVGILGGLTTFSTLNFEVFELIGHGRVTLGILYGLGSLTLGLALTGIGYWIGNYIG